jgi:uncharacterized membrane protein YfcA
MLDFTGFSAATLVLLTLGAFAGGFVNGLTGFGTGLSAMPIWLQAVSPALAAQLAAAGGVAGQLTTLRSIWHAIDWRALAPMLLAGLVAVPLGAMLVPLVDATVFKRAVGAILIGYAAVMLTAGGRIKMAPKGPLADVAVGFSGGLLAGIAGLSGVTPTVWAALQGWSKERRRGVFQAFNLTILSTTLLAHLAKGLVDPQFLKAFVVALPGTFLGVACGQYVYARLDDRRFDRVVLIVLGLAGFGLMTTTLRA